MPSEIQQQIDEFNLRYEGKKEMKQKLEEEISRLEKSFSQTKEYITEYAMLKINIFTEWIIATDFWPNKLNHWRMHLAKLRHLAFTLGKYRHNMFFV